MPAPTIRIAAAGDIHCHEGNRAEIVEAFARIGERADLVLLAGDLTTHGEPEQAAVLANACSGLDVPVFAVLGNHDWHANRMNEVVRALETGGITVIDRRSAILEVRGVSVGLAGAKGFVGGFADSELPDFGEPLLRAVYAETGAEVRALDVALEEIAGCPIRIALLHYSPTTTTLEGERPTLWTYLGSDRLADTDRRAPADDRSARPRPRRHVRGLHRPDPGLQRRRARHGHGLLDLRVRPRRKAAPQAQRAGACAAGRPARRNLVTDCY